MNYQDIIVDTLRKLGFEPEMTEGGYYKFNYLKSILAYFPDEEDSSFLRIAIPYVEDITEDNRQDVIKAILHTMNSIKYIRINTLEDKYVWLQYDHYLHISGNSSEEQIREELEYVIEHIVRVLYYSLITFREAIPEENESDTYDQMPEQDLEEEFKTLLCRLTENKESEGNEDTEEFNW